MILLASTIETVFVLLIVLAAGAYLVWHHKKSSSTPCWRTGKSCSHGKHLKSGQCPLVDQPNQVVPTQDIVKSAEGLARQRQSNADQKSSNDVR
jgi:hypothetical protein